MAQYQRIFAALDGASTQEAVAQRAAALAADNGARLLFGHVIDSVPNEANGADFLIRNLRCDVLVVKQA